MVLVFSFDVSGQSRILHEGLPAEVTDVTVVEMLHTMMTTNLKTEIQALALTH